MSETSIDNEIMGSTGEKVHGQHLHLEARPKAENTDVIPTPNNFMEGRAELPSTDPVDVHATLKSLGITGVE